MTSNRYLRYYAPTYNRSRHNNWIQLLLDIEKEHEIRWEEVPTASSWGSVDFDWYGKRREINEEEIWNSELKYNMNIKQNDADGKRPGRKFKSHQGHHYIQGTIAVIDPKAGIIHGEKRDNATDLLQLVGQNGESVLFNLAPED